MVFWFYVELLGYWSIDTLHDHHDYARIRTAVKAGTLLVPIYGQGDCIAIFYIGEWHKATYCDVK